MIWEVRPQRCPIVSGKLGAEEFDTKTEAIMREIVGKAITRESIARD